MEKMNLIITGVLAAAMLAFGGAALARGFTYGAYGYQSVWQPVQPPTVCAIAGPIIAGRAPRIICGPAGQIFLPF